MHPRSPSTALLLTMIVLVAAIFTGCGGGGQAEDGGQQNGGAKGQGKKGQGKGNALEEKTLLGTVGFVNPKTGRFTVRPRIEEQGKKPIVFKLASKARITLGGEEVELEDMKKGQQAQVEYVVRGDRNVARVVTLFEGGGDSEEEQGSAETG